MELKEFIEMEKSRPWEYNFEFECAKIFEDFKPGEDIFRRYFTHKASALKFCPDGYYSEAEEFIKSLREKGYPKNFDCDSCPLANLKGGLQNYKSYADNIEFPNPAEGIDKIYEVVDDKITMRTDTPHSEIIEEAHKELAEEADRTDQEDEAKKKRKELLESMKHRPFWHYCEVCGKKEFITAEEAYNAGWDYPPNIGTFGLLSPRTCGDCTIDNTLFWKINTSGGLPIVIENSLSPEKLVTWHRIKAEPESLLDKE